MDCGGCVFAGAAEAMRYGGRLLERSPIDDPGWIGDNKIRRRWIDATRLADEGGQLDIRLVERRLRDE